MIFSRTTEYAFRVMAYIASRDSSLPLRAKDLATEVNVPVSYTSKILSRMSSAGLLQGAKGHGGGFVLSRPINRIRFLDIFEAIEGKLEARRCVFGLKRCSNVSPCILHFRWSQLNEAFQKWARETSLADVKADADKLGPLKAFVESEIDVD